MAATDPVMTAEAVATPTQFLQLTEQFRAGEPILTNLLATVAMGASAGRQYEHCWWWVVRDTSGRVVGCACRTVPYPLVLSPMPPQAAAALAARVTVMDPALPGITGPRPVVDALLGSLQPPRAHRVRMAELVKTLRTYVPPPDVPGRARRAGPEDRDLLVEWFEQFQRDAGLVQREPRDNVVAMLANRALWWWEVAGRPVSLAGHGPIVAGIGRVGPVFTPEPCRRKGYAAAVTAAVLTELLPRCSSILLFTDAANATSNGVYERLGFQTAARFVEVALE